jgi:hypothetical protein
MGRMISWAVILLAVFLAAPAGAADVVPNEIQQPGTQPGEVNNLESPDKCDNCHGGYNVSVEPAFNWRGSMMANAGRDPIFWATLAVAEQDFDGAGDLCLRCHTSAGWLAGRSLPTDGSGLGRGDGDGVECEVCHKMVNPDNSEHQGVQFSPFLAYDMLTGEGYYGSGMYVMWGSSDKLGPYGDAAARHQFLQSQFHRSRDFCGTCHDVSNPAVGDLAPNYGAQDTADEVIASGVLGSPLTEKAAFNNFPFQYGIVERTYSEFKAGALSSTPVSYTAYTALPADLQGGALQAAYESALGAGTGGKYEDGTTRYFTCQTCHLRPVSGPGCNKKGAPVRKDLPLHDMTGGNYWMPDAIAYLDGQGKLLVGGGLSDTQLAALEAGKARAMKQLSEGVSLSVSGNTVRLVNQTGHKVISGYPEGRRMWLNIKWYDAEGLPIREDGAYGPVTTITFNGTPYSVQSLINPNDTNTKVYEAHYAMTREWAAKLVGYGYDPNLPLSYDRYTGAADFTLGELAASAPGTYHETFHFVLNNYVAKDNRIPPYKMSYDEARKRNALPVPADQYGNPGPGGVYNYYDEVTLTPPSHATYASIDLLYQPTSWEYIQFLYLANGGQNAFLAAEGANLLEAWLQTGMAAPYVMASTAWGKKPVPQVSGLTINSTTTWSVDRRGNLLQQTNTFRVRDTVAVVVHAADPDGADLSGVQVFLDIRDAGGALVTSLQGFTGTDGTAALTWKTGRNDAGDYTATVTDALKSGYQFDAGTGDTTETFSVR